MNQEKSTLMEAVNIAKSEIWQKWNFSMNPISSLKKWKCSLTARNPHWWKRLTSLKLKQKKIANFLDESKTELANLKAHFDNEKSILDQEKSALMKAVTIVKMKP